jgi:hypothetical protein
MNQLDVDLARALAAERDAQRQAQQRARSATTPPQRHRLPALGPVLARLIPLRLLPRRPLG